MLVELSVMEQRYQAVLAVVQDGWKVVEVARRVGVSRQTLHAWIARYERGGLSSLADRSHRPSTCPHQTFAETEATICELRREHPGWGPPPDRAPPGHGTKRCWRWYRTGGRWSRWPAGVSLSDPAPDPGRQWLRHLCPTEIPIWALERCAARIRSSRR